VAGQCRGGVGDGGAVADEAGMGGDSLEAVPDAGGDHDEVVVVGPEEQLHDLAAGGRVHAIVVKDELHEAVRAGIVKGHPGVEVPGLDGAGIDPGEIDFAEAVEFGIVGAEHVHDLAALVGDLVAGSDVDAVDHGGDCNHAGSQGQIRMGPGVGAFCPGFAGERLAGEDGTTAIDIYLEVEADRGCHDFAAGERLSVRSRDKPLPREGGTARWAKS
jgi:hypothetical protein